MSLFPVYRICPKCKRINSFNPDVGRLYCPTCGPLTTKILLDRLLKRKRNGFISASYKSERHDTLCHASLLYCHRNPEKGDVENGT